MNWHDMNVILTIAREGSITGAARILNVAHTTIGRRITAIEKKLNTDLFIRKKIACVPTDECREILESIERMEAEALSISAYFNDYEKQPRGLVKVTTMPWVIQHIIVPALPSFITRFPQIELQLIADLRERSITYRETDLSLRFEMQPRNKEIALDLAPFSYSVYAADVDDPHKLKWVTFWEDHSSYNYAPIKWIGKKQASGEDICVRANDAGFVFEVIRTGMGKGLIPDFLAAKDAELICLSGLKPEFDRTLKLLYHSGMRNLARIDAVITWLQDTFNTL